MLKVSRDRDGSMLSPHLGVVVDAPPHGGGHVRGARRGRTPATSRRRDLSQRSRHGRQGRVLLAEIRANTRERFAVELTG